MGQNYINWMINALQEVFPNATDRQAASLAFRGLAKFRNAEPDYFDDLISAYDFSSVTDLTNETNSMQTGASGIICN